MNKLLDLLKEIRHPTNDDVAKQRETIRREWAEVAPSLKAKGADALEGVFSFLVSNIAGMQAIISHQTGVIGFLASVIHGHSHNHLSTDDVCELMAMLAEKLRPPEPPSPPPSPSNGHVAA